MARKIMDELIQHGSVAWGSIGAIRWYELNARQAQYYRYGNTDGLLVYDLDESSSAYRAGLRPEDFVIAVNGQSTTAVDQLDRIIVKAPIGSSVKVDFVRKGRQQSIEIPVVSRQTTTQRRR
jgi:S1-C subfamily serine protease